jgi:hypothetical protein
MLEILACLATVTGLFFWNRSESRADIRWMAEINKANRAEAKEDIRRMEGLLAAIHAEMKDFHGRLCALEEKSKGK